MEQQSSSSAVIDASNFYCNNCTVLRRLSVGPSSNVGPNSSAPVTSVFSEPQSVPPGSALVASIQERLKIVTEGISALRSEVSTFSGKIDSISDTLRGLAASVDNIQGQVNSLRREFGEVTQRCANLESRFTTVEASNSSLWASVENCKSNPNLI